MAKMHNGLTMWTCDAVASCLPLNDDVLGEKLWDILANSKNRTPAGGEDYETPDCLLDEDNDDKAPHWWGLLTDDEQITINLAYEKEYDGWGN